MSWEELDFQRLPPPLRPLIGVARRWGEPDDGYRDEAIEAASTVELVALIAAVDNIDEIDDYLGDTEIVGQPPSDEYIAMSAFHGVRIRQGDHPLRPN